MGRLQMENQTAVPADVGRSSDQTGFLNLTGLCFKQKNLPHSLALDTIVHRRIS